jgi:hypothetical protein
MLTPAERRAKLATLVAIEGYDNVEELAQAILSDSVSSAICRVATLPAKWSRIASPREHTRSLPPGLAPPIPSRRSTSHQTTASLQNP